MTLGANTPCKPGDPMTSHARATEEVPTPPLPNPSHLPRDPLDRRLCGARTRRGDGARCRSFGMIPSGRCRLHGGKSPRGIGSSSLRHGHYSRCLLTRIAAQLDALRAAAEEAASGAERTG